MKFKTKLDYFNKPADYKYITIKIIVSFKNLIVFA